MKKLIRNNWGALKVMRNGKGEDISWYYIEKLYRYQEKEEVVAGNKFRRSHAAWKKKNKKVKLAVQVSSRSVADALEFLNKDLKVPQFRGCEATVRFIRLIDDLFDLINSRNPFGRGTKRPLRKSNQAFWMKKMEDAMDELKSLKDLQGNRIITGKKKAGVLGMLVDAVAFRELFEDCCLCEEPILQYLLAYKLSQDHLELFLFAVRSMREAGTTQQADFIKLPSSACSTTTTSKGPTATSTPWMPPSFCTSLHLA